MKNIEEILHNEFPNATSLGKVKKFFRKERPLRDSVEMFNNEAYNYWMLENSFQDLEATSLEFKYLIPCKDGKPLEMPDHLIGVDCEPSDYDFKLGEEYQTALNDVLFDVDFGKLTPEEYFDKSIKGDVFSDMEGTKVNINYWKLIK